MRRDKTADLVAFDREENPVLVVEVNAKPHRRAEARDAFVSWVVSHRDLFPFGMYVTPTEALIFRSADDDPLAGATRLNTVNLLRPYSDQFQGEEPPRGSIVAFEHHITTLVDVWLGDLAFHWKFADPPAAEVLGRIGLLERLEKGITQQEVPLGLALR